MKNISLILNGILIVAVGVLYYLHFTGSKSSSSSSVSAPADLKFAYIKSDSVLKYYDFFKDMKTIYEAKNKRLDKDLQNRAQSLQTDIEAYQRNVGNLTIGQAKAVEEDLGKKQQNFQLFRQSVEQEVINDQNKLTEQLYGKITAFLKKYAEGSDLQVVMKYDQTSDVLFGGPGIDISQDVIKGLNDEYKIEKQSSTKTDSTSTKK
ncbi:MAG: OmpH family outer membrane protein [Bacteroidetes bacterium]|nr:OmpH family outer membrane protein [Bacteroidota bacterium]